MYTYVCVCVCVCVGAGRRLARRAERNAAVMQRKLIFCQQLVQDLRFKGSGLGLNPEEVDGLTTGFADSSTAMPPGVTAFSVDVGIPEIPACCASSSPAWKSLSLANNLSLSLSPPLSPSWPSLDPCFSLNLATMTLPSMLESPTSSSPCFCTDLTNIC